MTDMPAVTVVIPTRDRPAWLVRAVRLARAQRDVDVRVVVVDDASADGDAVARAVPDDPRIDLMRRDASPGSVAAARNAGLDRVATEYVAFLDDDDVWHPSWLVTATGALRAKGATFAYGAVVLLDSDGRPCGWEPAPRPGEVPEALVHDNVVGIPSQVVLRTDAVREAGGWDPRFSAVADWALWLALRDRPCAAVDDALVGYTVHRGGMHLSAPDEMLAEFRLLWEVTGLPGPDERRFKRWMAMELGRFGDPAQAARLYRELSAEEHRPADLLRAARYAVPYRTGLRRRFSRMPRTAWWPAAQELSCLARGEPLSAEAVDA